MSMSIQPANSTTGYSNGRTQTGIGQGQGEGQKQDTTANIKSVEALTKAELRGAKVTVGDEQLVKNIERALKAIEGPHTAFEMSVHKATNTIVVKVLDKDTGELIREIPPEKTLDLVAKFMEINGILIDEKV
jgi:flagellar protein FlaG